MDYLQMVLTRCIHTFLFGCAVLA